MNSERFMLLYDKVKQRVFLLRWVRNFIMSREGLISALPPYINVPLQMHHAHTPRLPYAALLLPALHISPSDFLGFTYGAYGLLCLSPHLGESSVKKHGLFTAASLYLEQALAHSRLSPLW